MTTVATDLAEVTSEPSVVTIGNFDGVHRGHRVLLRRAVDTASERDARSVAVTFEPHPAAVLRPGSEPLRLQSLDDRVDALGEAGIELVVVLAFTRELASLTPETFVERVLAGPLGAVRVVVGTNFRFGRGAAGDVVTLVEQGERFGFDVEAVTLLERDGEALSSSAVRQLVADGDVARARAAIGRAFSLRAEVVSGEGRGRTIGVPTANLDVPDGQLVPGNGVYACRVRWDDRTADAVTNVGVRPTFEGTDRTVEVHLLDAEVDLYGRQLRVDFEHRIRGEQRFDGPDQLVARIREDIEEARQRLGSSDRRATDERSPGG